MSKPMPDLKNSKLSELANDLTVMWLKWMAQHNISNDKCLSYKERRAGGEKCEELQAHRRELVRQIDKLFDDYGA